MTVLRALFTLVIYGFSVQTTESKYMSSCPENEITPWNKHLVSQHIKYWIESIQIIGPEPINDRKIRFNNETEFVDFIVRVDPATRKPIGDAWKVVGENKVQYLDGFLVGPLNKKKEISGDNVVFLFPDMETALVGKWRRNVMKEARAARVIAERCQNGMKVLKLKLSKKNRGVYKYQRPSRNQPGDQPTLIDPYEQRTIYIGDGLKDDGVFAKRDIKQGEMVAYYAGLLLTDKELPPRLENMTDMEVVNLERNYISLSEDINMDLPMRYWSLSHYRATLAHKLNHSFTRSKTQFYRANHPRYGWIPCVIALEDIYKGEEIFVDYNYVRSKEIAPLWYQEVYEKEVGGRFEKEDD